MKKFHPYIIGFSLSLILTLVAFGLVWFLPLSPQMIAVILLCLALVQLFVQIFFFLHIGAASQWNKMTLVLALLIVLFVVGGSLWIMAHLKHLERVPFDGEVTPHNEH